MTKQQFLNEFYLMADKYASSALSGYLPDEIAATATIAQEKLVLNWYNPKTNPLLEGFEQTEKRTQDLGNLVKGLDTSTFISNSNNMDNGVFVSLPNTQLTDPTDFSDVFWLPIYEEVTTNKKQCETDENYMKVPVMEISHVEFNQLIIDPFNKPKASKDAGVFRLRFEGNLHELITDGTFNITSYRVRYIKKPTPIDLSTNLTTTQVSELSDYVHRKLLQVTINEFLDNTNSPKAQIKKQEIIE